MAVPGAAFSELAALVSEAHLQWGIVSHENPESQVHLHSYTPTFMFVSRDHIQHLLAREKAVRTLNSEQLADVAVAYEKIQQLQGEQLLISEAARLFKSSFTLPLRSPLRALSLFAAIEFLITHKPAANETGDSITKQIKSKLALAGRRFRQPMNPEQEFQNAGSKGWGMLYKYRSIAAHGGKADFTRPYNNGGVKELISQEEILYFLEEFTRRLLRQALNEPQLFLDLKQC